MSGPSITKPAGSPSGVPSGALEECTAFVIVTRSPAISIAPPLPKPTVSVTPWPPSQPASSGIRRDGSRVLLGDRGDVAGVIAVAVREQDRVAALDREPLGPRGIAGDTTGR